MRDKHGGTISDVFARRASMVSAANMISSYGGPRKNSVY